MGKAAAAQPDFNAALTGAAQLAALQQNAQTTANAARKDALQSATNTQMLGMAIAGNIVGGVYGNNPTAGSDAASAITGKGGSKSDASSKKAKASDKKDKSSSDGGNGDDSSDSSDSDDDSGNGGGS
jgi:hypothetical protein